jgi:hypothetical protein
MRTFLLSSLLFTGISIHAQVITTDPPFPTQDDFITISYDAGEGNQELMGVFPVFAHTGVISNYSSSATDWQHVVGDWGTNDSDVLMVPQGNNIHTIVIQPSTFYGLNADEVVTHLAFVFRNQSGSLVGRNADGSDIFIPLYQAGFNANIVSPAFNNGIISPNEDVNFVCEASSSATLTLTVNGIEVANEINATTLNYTFSETSSGEYEIVYTADNGIETIEETVSLVIVPEVNVAASPLGTIDGINYINTTAVRLQFYAPGKDYLFVVGDFNDWAYDLDYMMNRTPDGNTWWLDITGLTPGQEYRFQYYIGEDNMRVAEIYADKILDYWNDPWIDDNSYPNLIEYPVGLTSEPVSVLQTNQPVYNWTDGSYQRPDKEKLIIYELLVRDFLEDGNYQTLLDTLDYLENMGINAIQFMPINEFEGNESWGYNPSFYFAPDKNYGTKAALKDFIDECHSRGMAVIMDIALNHSFGQNPMVRMYFDADAGQYGEPTSDNPWFNETPKHDFNVGYDFNHEQPRTREFCKRVFEYWLEIYHIDGFRLDLSKGYTQVNTLGNTAQWGVYDQSRINILIDYFNHSQSVEPGSYFILEHFANNDEETVLANTGMMLWGNLNYQFNEASMGYSSNLNWGNYQQRGWGNPHLITYAESHDEERLMYKNLLYGNSAGSYDITDLTTALKRQELIHTLLIPLPGPKMIWQFGELGYDYSINTCSDGVTITEDCRTDSKPIRWDYRDVEQRLHLYKWIAALNNLKTEYPTFSTSDYTYDAGGFGKRIILNHADMDAVVVGNFQVTDLNMVPGFQQTGTWYDYATSSPVEVNDLGSTWFFPAGDFHVYTDMQLPAPDLNVGLAEILEFTGGNVSLYPNPADAFVNVLVEVNVAETVSCFINDFSGRQVFANKNVPLISGANKIEMSIENLPNGSYILNIIGEHSSYSLPLVVTGR